MPTTPGGIWTPNDTDDWDLIVDLAAMAVSIDDSVNSAIGAIRQSYVTGSNAQRLALSGANLFEGLRFWVTESRAEWLYTGGSWQDMTNGVRVNLTNTGANWAATGGYAPYILAIGKWRFLYGAVTRSTGGSLATLLTIPVGHRPTENVFLNGGTTSGGTPYSPVITAASGVLAITYGGGSAPGVYPLTGSWRVA